MNPNTEIETERLLLRPWNMSEQDRRAFHFLMSDEQVRQYYPTEKTRAESDASLERLVASYEHSQFAWVAACLKETSEPIGFTGLAKVDFEATFSPTVEIGWMYKPTCWKRGFASEAARALLKHGFNDLRLDEIVAFTAEINTPSQAVMRSIGMSNDPNDKFDHPSIGDDSANLRPHILYRLSRDHWQNQKGR